MKKIFLSIIFVLLSTSFTLAAHKGKVYIDLNGNGSYDKGERLLSGVMISDGLNVVKTNKNGEFQLEGHPNARFISITTPNGYKAQHSHYIKIDKRVDSYDFALEVWNNRINKDGTHQFIQVADTEIFNTTDHKRWVDNIRDYAMNEDIAFIVHTGDICYENGMKRHKEIMNSDNMGLPVYYCVGNHDLIRDYEKKGYERAEQLFEELYGPVWYSFDYGNVHYIVLPMPIGDAKPSYTEADVYAWLKNDLANVKRGTPIVIFKHWLKSMTGEFIFKKSDEEYIDLNDYNLKGWFYGHWHFNCVINLGNVKTVGTSCPDKAGVDHSTTAFRVATLDDNGNIKTELRYTYMHNNIEIASIGGDDMVSYTPDGLANLSVNTYNTVSPTQTVTYKLTDKGGTTIIHDKKLKQNTDWNWSIGLDIPQKYIDQRVFVEVKASYKNGEEAKAIESFIYNPKNKTTPNVKEDWTNLLSNTEHTKQSDLEMKLPLQLAWTTNIKTNILFSSPIIYKGTLYLGAASQNLKEEDGIYALDTTNGTLKWHFKTRNSVVSSISTDSDLIFAQDTEGYLYAIDAQKGTLVWEKRIRVTILPSLTDGLIAKDGVVYAGTRNGLAAYEAKTGKVIWENQSWNAGLSYPGTLSANSEVLMTGSQWEGIYANNIKTGELVWSLKSDVKNRGGSPAIYNGLAYFGSGRAFHIIDVKTGKHIVKKDLNYNVDAISTPLVTDDLIVFGTIDNGLVALNRATMEEEWKVVTNAALVYTGQYTRHPVNTVEPSPVRIGDKIFFGASDGILYGVGIKSGMVEWQHEIGAPIFGAAAISGDTFFVADFAGNIYAFKGKE